MQLRGRTITPVIGGVAVAATAVGAFAPATQVAVAAPDHAAGASSPLGLAQEGVFESCSAYFGFGKGDEETMGGGFNAVAFDVTDESGDDDGVHAVPDDVDVVLVIELEDEVLECVPEEVTEAEWEAFVEDGLLGGEMSVDWPGPGYYAYPSVGLFELLSPGMLRSVGFRVVGFPGDHTLVSPVGVQPLQDPFGSFIQQYVALMEGGIEAWEPSVRILEIITTEAGPDAASAYQDAAATCSADPEAMIPVDEDLAAAFGAVLGYLGIDEPIPGGEPGDEVDCEIILVLDLFITYLTTVEAIADNREPIVLAGPSQQPTTSTTAPTAPPTGAQPVTAAPNYTG